MWFVRASKSQCRFFARGLLYTAENCVVSLFVVIFTVVESSAVWTGICRLTTFRRTMIEVLPFVGLRSVLYVSFDFISPLVPFG